MFGSGVMDRAMLTSWHLRMQVCDPTDRTELVLKENYSACLRDLFLFFFVLVGAWD